MKHKKEIKHKTNETKRESRGTKTKTRSRTRISGERRKIRTRETWKRRDGKRTRNRSSPEGYSARCGWMVEEYGKSIRCTTIKNCPGRRHLISTKVYIMIKKIRRVLEQLVRGNRNVRSLARSLAPELVGKFETYLFHNQVVFSSSEQLWASKWVKSYWAVQCAEQATKWSHSEQCRASE